MKKGLRRTGPQPYAGKDVRTVDLMKKGLRLDVRLAKPGGEVRTVDLMKKGLRLHPMNTFLTSSGQNRRPDEEGIKTQAAWPLSREPEVRTVDLMKKGLRRR